MSIVASIPALPAQASQAVKERTGGYGRKGAAGTEFGSLLCVEAGPAPVSAGATVAPIAADGGSNPISPMEVDGTFLGAAAGGQPRFIVRQGGSDAGGKAELNPAEVAPHVQITNLQLSGSGGKIKLPIHSGDAGEGFSIETRSISPGSGDTKEMSSSHPAKGLHASGGKKGADASSDRKAETVPLPPAAGQMALAVLSPCLPVLPSAGNRPEKLGTGNSPVNQTADQRSALDLQGEVSQLPTGEPGQKATTSITVDPDSAAVNHIAPLDAEFDFDAPTPSGKEVLLNVVGGQSNVQGQFSLHAGRAPEKLVSGAGANSLLPGTLVAQASGELPMAVAQHSGPMSSTTSSATGGAVGMAGSSTPNLYDRIDQGSAPMDLHSGLQHVSVGLHDPDLGWVEIQAKSAAGHVDAALITNSGQTHTSLAMQLPAIAQYLEQRDVRVGTLVVHHHAMGSRGPGGGGGSGGLGYGSGNSGAGTHHSNAGNSGHESHVVRSGGTALENRRNASRMDAGARRGEEVAYGPISYISVRV